MVEQTCFFKDNKNYKNEILTSCLSDCTGDDGVGGEAYSISEFG